MANTRSSKRSSLLQQLRSFFNQTARKQNPSVPPATTSAATVGTPSVMASKAQPLEIAILGAGIGGLGLAIGLIRRGVPVTIYEAASQFSPIGAGIGFGPNSLNAIDLIDSRFRQEYERAKTANEKPEFEHCVFDAMYAEEGFGEEKGWKQGFIGADYFTRSSAHRKDLLEIMEGFIPKGTVKFNKRAKSVTETGGKVVVIFEDGEVISVDTLIGGDGVKGITRKLVIGDIAPELVPPTYCNMYIYRGIIPMDKCKEILGYHAGDAKWFMAYRKGVAIYPISQGKEENFVFFVCDDKPWTQGDSPVPCTKEEMIQDLQGFDSRLIQLLDYAKPLRWPTFHHPETPTYHKGRVAIIGDCAHASSPHQAAGAGQGLEDAVVLSHLLALVKKPEQLDAAFRIYDSIRRPRAQKVVNTSYDAGTIYTWQHPEIGNDMAKIVANANERLHWIWQHDLKGDMQKAEDQFYAATSVGVDAGFGLAPFGEKHVSSAAETRELGMAA